MENIEIFEFVFDSNVEDDYDYRADDNRKETLESLAD